MFGTADTSLGANTTIFDYMLFENDPKNFQTDFCIQEPNFFFLNISVKTVLIFIFMPLAKNFISFKKIGVFRSRRLIWIDLDDQDLILKKFY